MSGADFPKDLSVWKIVEDIFMTSLESCVKSGYARIYLSKDLQRLGQVHCLLGIKPPVPIVIAVSFGVVSTTARIDSVATAPENILHFIPTQLRIF